VTDPIDIKALDEYLKGGSDLSQRYRELGREDVPPELDRRVLDEARAAVANVKGGRSSSWLRWSAPVALAASLVLVVTVVIESGVQNDASFATRAVQEKPAEPQLQPESPPSSQRQFVPEEPLTVVNQAAPATAPAETLAKSAQNTDQNTDQNTGQNTDKRARMEAQRADNAAREEVRVETKGMRDQALATSPVVADTVTADSAEPELANAQQPASPSFAGAPSVRPAAASSEESTEVSTTSASRTRRAGRTAGPRSTIPSALSSETRPAADEDAEQIDPAKWLEEIRELRRAGKVVEADRGWLRFREAYPDFPVASDDLARKKP
jgi:hypothetical protein